MWGDRGCVPLERRLNGSLGLFCLESSSRMIRVLFKEFCRWGACKRGETSIHDSGPLHRK